jgi:tetratricopeptide (TPR) repeat protein
MQYRVVLAKDYEHDSTKAATLQKKLVELHRREAAAALALPVGARLDAKERHQLRDLGVSMFMLGRILAQEGDPECLEPCRESLDIDRRLGDSAAQANSEFNLGDAYIIVPAIRDLDEAEAAYRRSLDLRDAADDLGRSMCLTEIGNVHFKRFVAARERNEPIATLIGQAEAAQEHYLEGLRLCPKDALAVLARTHNCLGALYGNVRQLDSAREHFERAIQYMEKAGSQRGAGHMRFNIALLYFQTAQDADQSPQQRANLLRAEAYAVAALRDYQGLKGPSTEAEGNCEGLLKAINQALATPRQ